MRTLEYFDSEAKSDMAYQTSSRRPFLFERPPWAQAFDKLSSDKASDAWI